MRIELLCFGGCPGAAEALSTIKRVVAEAELDAKLVPVDVGAEAHPGFSGSPTVLVDGEDPFPASCANAVSCRLYETPKGLKSFPTEAMLRTVIRAKIGV